MRTCSLARLLLVIACCLAEQLVWAQRSAVAPLTPLHSVVVPTNAEKPLEGVQVGPQPARQALAPVATAPAERRSWPQPIFLLNSRIIISELSAVNPQAIATVRVYKGSEAPPQWHSLLENGLLDITLKAGTRLKLKTESLATIRRRLKVPKPVSFRLNGLPIQDASLRVATASIAGFDILPGAAETTVNIRLAPPKPSPPRPPGTILIRGIASR